MKGRNPSIQASHRRRVCGYRENCKDVGVRFYEGADYH
jgi:hypothetical protein